MRNNVNADSYSLGRLVGRPVQQRLDERTVLVRNGVRNADPDGHERRVGLVLHGSRGRSGRRHDRPSSLGDVGIAADGTEGEHVAEGPGRVVGGGGAQRQAENCRGGGRAVHCDVLNEGRLVKARNECFELAIACPMAGFVVFVLLICQAPCGRASAVVGACVWN